MHKCRHHIHIICDSSDSQLYGILDNLAIFFENRAFLTKDLFLVRPESANYSWRCINACDYAIVLLGQTYGKLTNTGVSQLHISYLNAKTKNKPLLAFIHSDADRGRQLRDMVEMISEQIDHCYYFDDSTDIDELLTKITQSTTPQDTATAPWLLSACHATHAQNDAKPTFGQYLLKRTDSPTTQDATYLTPPSVSNAQSAPLDSKASTKSSALKIDKSQASPILTTSATPAIASIQNPKTDLNLRHIAPDMHEDVLLNCTAHAFCGGTLSEMAFMTSLVWHDIVQKIAPQPSVTLKSLWRILNEMITPKALPIAQSQNPDVHAVSRCQVTKADVLWIQEELVLSGWLSQNNNVHPAVWQVSALAKNLLKT